MPRFHQKITKHTERQYKSLQKTVEATESDPDKAEMLEFSNQEFKNNYDYCAKNSNGYRGQ